MAGRAVRARAERVVREAVPAAVTRPRHVVLAAAVAGLLAGPRCAPVAVVAAVALLAAGGAARRLGLGLCAAAAVLAGALVADARLATAERPSVRRLLGSTLDERADLV